MTEIKRFCFDDKDIAEMAFEVRRIVFVDEQKVSREEEFDEYERESNHYLALYNNKPVGTARWRLTSKGIKLERFAVLKELRNKGIGNAVLNAVLKDLDGNPNEIYLHAQLSAVNFYKKAGFKEVGDHFWEADIEHVKMLYKP